MVISSMATILIVERRLKSNRVVSKSGPKEVRCVQFLGGFNENRICYHLSPLPNSVKHTIIP